MTARELCAEALYGIHGEPNTNGKCPYCGMVLRARGKGVGRPWTISLPRELYLDRLERRADVDMWGRVGVPADQDPGFIDSNFQDDYYDA